MFQINWTGNEANQIHWYQINWPSTHEWASSTGALKRNQLHWCAREIYVGVAIRDACAPLHRIDLAATSPCAWSLGVKTWWQALGWWWIEWIVGGRVTEFRPKSQQGARVVALAWSPSAGGALHPKRSVATRPRPSPPSISPPLRQPPRRHRALNPPYVSVVSFAQLYPPSHSLTLSLFAL